MKHYLVQNPDGNETLTEQDILDQYFEYWANCMIKMNKTNLISFERCIEDFCVIHGAVELEV